MKVCSIPAAHGTVDKSNVVTAMPYCNTMGKEESVSMYHGRNSSEEKLEGVSKCLSHFHNISCSSTWGKLTYFS